MNQARKESEMLALDTHISTVQSEADSLTQFLETLLADDWERLSACKRWTIRAVAAHIVWATTYYADAISRGIKGDDSHLPDRPPGDAPAAPPELSDYFYQQAMDTRDQLGDDLMQVLRSRLQALTNLMASLSPEQWEVSCAFYKFISSTCPAHAFLSLAIQELAIHGWDIRSRFDKSTTISEPSLAFLMERLTARASFLTQPIDIDPQVLVRYRFNFGADSALRYDLSIEGGKERMEPATDSLADVTIYCDRATFVLLLFDRFRLDSAISQGRVTIEGDESLARVLGQSLRPYV
jgi:uncharacterized protein (TIGR03083 family)